MHANTIIRNTRKTLHDKPILQMSQRTTNQGTAQQTGKQNMIYEQHTPCPYAQPSSWKKVQNTHQASIQNFKTQHLYKKG